jgi:hypothetical protein
VDALPLITALAGAIVGALATGTFGLLRDARTDAREALENLTAARREQYPGLLLPLQHAVRAAEDHVASWYGHQPDAPNHEHRELLAKADEAALTLTLLGGAGTQSIAEALLAAVREARDTIDFWDEPKGVTGALESFQSSASPHLDGLLPAMRSDLGTHH